MEAPFIAVFCLLSLAFLLIGGTIGWLFQQHQLVFSTQAQTNYLHPEFYDENGNVIPDEILALIFENYDNSEEDDYYEEE